MGRTAPPFAIPGPSGLSLFLRSPSSPSHCRSLLSSFRFHLSEEALFSRSHTMFMVHTRILFPSRTAHRYFMLLALSSSLSASIVTHLVEISRFLFVPFTLFTIINVFPTNISTPPMMLRARMDARQRDDARACVCVRPESSALPLFRCGPGRESAFQFYYPPWYDLDNEILRGIFRPPSELHSTIIEIRMERVSRVVAVARSSPMIEERGRNLWAQKMSATLS